MKAWASSYAFDRTFRIGRLEIRPNMRRADGFMGRFGGGWNWKLGVMIGGTTVITDLLVMSIRFTWKPASRGEKHGG